MFIKYNDKNWNKSHLVNKNLEFCSKLNRYNRLILQTPQKGEKFEIASFSKAFKVTNSNEDRFDFTQLKCRTSCNNSYFSSITDFIIRVYFTFVIMKYFRLEYFLYLPFN